MSELRMACAAGFDRRYRANLDVLMFYCSLPLILPNASRSKSSRVMSSLGGLWYMLRLERTTGTGVAVLFAFEALEDFLGGGVGTFFPQVPTAFIFVL